MKLKRIARLMSRAILSRAVGLSLSGEWNL